jgi:hypothetical protein
MKSTKLSCKSTLHERLIFLPEDGHPTNQPANKFAQGGFAEGVPCQAKPFLHMKHMADTRKLCSINYYRLCANPNKFSRLGWRTLRVHTMDCCYWRQKTCVWKLILWKCKCGVVSGSWALKFAIAVAEGLLDCSVDRSTWGRTELILAAGITVPLNWDVGDRKWKLRCQCIND